MSKETNRTRCQGLTHAGQPCKNTALPGSSYCRVHQAASSNGGLHPVNGEFGTAEEQPPIFINTAEDNGADRELEEIIQELDEVIVTMNKFRINANGFDGEQPEAIDEPVEKVSRLDRIRSTVSEDLFDIDTWKGFWYVVNSTVEQQKDWLKRRLNGEYETDEWGLDMEFLEIVKPFFKFMYKTYWRVETTGLENIPGSGRALLVVNHSGQLPWDGAMVGLAILDDHPEHRLVRTLYASWFPTLPFFSAFLTKLGQALATEENGIRLLEQDQLVAVFPEGYKGVGKLFKDRYRLARFGRGGFIRMALQTRAPIIPVSVVGAEETYISLAKSSSIAKMIHFPYFPISPTFPWLGPLGFVPLPTKWYIDFGEPIAMDCYQPGAENNLVLVSQLTDQVRNVVQEMILNRLSQRKSVFLG